MTEAQRLASESTQEAQRPRPDLAERQPPRVEPAEAPKQGFKERFQALMTEYGSLALYVYFAIFAIVIVSFALAIQLGVKTDSTAATAGTWGAAWVATKLTQPLRIAATLVLTPIIGNLRRRLRGGSPRAPS